MHDSEEISKEPRKAGVRAGLAVLARRAGNASGGTPLFDDEDEIAAHLVIAA